MNALPLCAEKTETRCDRLRVLLAAPATAHCTRLERYLAHSPKVEVVGRADQESHALKLYARTSPDIAVLDWRTAEGQPARLIALLRRAAPDACVVSIVPSLDSMPARAARALGADYVITCDTLPSVIDALLARRV